MSMKAIFRFVPMVMMACMFLSVSAQDVLTRPKSHTNKSTSSSKKKVTPSTRTPQSPQSYFDRGMSSFKRSDYSEAMKWFLKAAEEGDVNAQRWIGVMYNIGYGVKSDYEEAVKWFRLAADHGHAEAQDDLGNMYLYGHGVDQNYGEAVGWYRKSAEQGHLYGQRSLARMYEKGWGVPMDYEEAAKWYRKAAAQGDNFSKDALKRIGK